MDDVRLYPFSRTDPTADGLAVGVNDSLDVSAWHTTFTEYPDWLKPLAYKAGTQSVAAIGGVPVIFPVTPGGEFPVHASPSPSPSPGLLDGVTGLEMDFVREQCKGSTDVGTSSIRRPYP